MATLRDLRKLAKDKGIEYAKETTAEELEELIAAHMAEHGEVGTAAPAAATSSPEDRTPMAKAAPTPAVTKEAPIEEPDSGSDDSRIDFATAVKINEANLTDEFARQPTLFSHFGRCEAVAASNLMAAKLRLETVEAELTTQYRTELSKDGGKPTEKTISSAVITDGKYQEARNDVIQATEDAAVAKTAREAFIQRKDMLIQLGTARRQEIEQIGFGLHEKAKGVVGTAS